MTVLSSAHKACQQDSWKGQADDGLYSAGLRCYSEVCNSGYSPSNCMYLEDSLTAMR